MGGGDDPHQVDRTAPCRAAGTGRIGPVESTPACVGQELEPDCEGPEYRASEPDSVSGRGHHRTLARHPGPYEEGVRCPARDCGALAAPMSAAHISIDERLDEWGSRLFHVSTSKSPRSGSSQHVRLGSAKPVSTGG